MSTAKRRATLDAALASIDAALADYKADRREAWIEENLNHPGQMHVALASASWFREWEDSEISDEQAQALADETTATVEVQAAREFVRRVVCWYCGCWTRPGCQMHGACRREWAAAKCGHARFASDATAYSYEGWALCLRPDGTGWGGEWDEDARRYLPPGELVDGIGLTVSAHATHMARLK